MSAQNTTGSFTLSGIFSLSAPEIVAAVEQGKRFDPAERDDAGNSQLSALISRLAPQTQMTEILQLYFENGGEPDLAWRRMAGGQELTELEFAHMFSGELVPDAAIDEIYHSYAAAIRGLPEPHPLSEGPGGTG